MQGLSKISALAKKIGEAKLRAAGAVVCASALFVTLAVTSSKAGGDTKQETAQPESTQVQTELTRKMPITQFKKAQLSEYDMAQTQAVSSVNDSVSEDKKQSSEAFKVLPEQKSFTFSDKNNAPSRLYATRDTSSEFFTVRDITTGKTVTMNAHELVCAIVYNEVGDGWSAEAIKAQAVAAYSCLRYSDSIGMLETVGIKKNYSQTIENCVRSVEGQVVTYGGKIANTLYSASNAGYTIPSGDVFVSKYPYLTCVKSAYDDQDPNWGRKVTFSKEQVKTTLEKKFGIKLSDDVKNWFKITDSRYGKYIFGVSIDSKANTTGNAIKTLFKLRSSAFDISYSKGTFTFTTYGWGHGVGMSQWGACLYARHGYTYDQILTHYYVNTKLSLSSVSTKAVERGKKSQQELDKEAQSASQTTAETEPELSATVSSGVGSSVTKPSDTQVCDAQTEKSESSSGSQNTSEAKDSEQTQSQTQANTSKKETTAEKVTKSAENAE